MGLLGREVEQVEPAAVLEDDVGRPDRREVHVVLGERRHLAHLAGARCRAPRCCCACSRRGRRGSTASCRATSAGCSWRRRPRPRFEACVARSNSQMRETSTAAVALPGAEVLAVRHEGQGLAVGRDLAELAVRHRQLLRQPALGRELVELVEAQAAARHRRGVEDRLAVRVPVQHPVGHRVVGEAPRQPAARGHHVDVLVAVVVAGERDQRAVRREARERLLALGRREPLRDATRLRGDPDVARVDEGDLGRRHRRLPHQPRVDRREGRHGGAREHDQQRVAKTLINLPPGGGVMRPAGCVPCLACS